MNSKSFDAMLDEIADRIVERLLPRLSPAAPSAALVVFTTHKAGPRLPGKSRGWMLEHIKDMPGAKKVGRDWVIAEADYNAWVQAEDARRCKLAGSKPPPVPRLSKVRSIPGNDISYAADDEADLQRRVERSLQAQGQRRSK